MIWGLVPEYDYPGICVEEAGGKPKPVDGVPTGAGAGDALTRADGPHFLYWIVIGGAALAGVGIALAVIRGNAVVELVRMPGGAAAFAAVFVSAFVLSMSRALVEWRRRRAGRPPLRPGRVALGLVVFQLATLVAVGICLFALAVSLAVAPAFARVLLAAAIDVLFGCIWIWLAGAALRDLLLLVEAARDDP